MFSPSTQFPIYSVSEMPRQLLSRRAFLVTDLLFDFNQIDQDVHRKYTLSSDAELLLIRSLTLGKVISKFSYYPRCEVLVISCLYAYLCIYLCPLSVQDKSSSARRWGRRHPEGSSGVCPQSSSITWLRWRLHWPIEEAHWSPSEDRWSSLTAGSWQIQHLTQWKV